MMDSVDEFANDANGVTGYLIDGAADKVQWARKQAIEFLAYADSLEERAASYRHLAGLMVEEAQEYVGEVADLLAAEFPTEGDEIKREEPDE